RPGPAGGAWSATSLGSGAPPGALGPLRGAALAPTGRPGPAGRPGLAGSLVDTPGFAVGVRHPCVAFCGRDDAHGVSDTGIARRVSSLVSAGREAAQNKRMIQSNSTSVS